ncbi:hypothetical protein GCM10028827_09410 [Mucilaginibacter myungsuensis]
MIFSAAAFAQQADRPLIQLTGVVVNADSTDVIVPYVTVTNLSNNNQANVANYKGYFSFVVHEGDSLRFTCVGYTPQVVVLPKEIPTKSHTLKVLMKSQIINLPTFHVFPWATTEEFRKDFLTMKVADDDLEIARKNLSKGSLAELSKVLARDAHEIQSAYAQNQHRNIMNQQSLMPNPLLNPIAWGTLINNIIQGDKSRGK